MDERKKFVVEAILAASTRRSNKQQSLKSGLIIRDQLHQALSRGQIPSHPRFDWLRRQARMLLETVINIVKDYEKQNPGSGDRGSMADALDIAEITANNIKGIIQSGELDPDMVDLVPFDEVKENLLANTEETDPDDEEDE